MKVINCEQGSPEWFQARLGRPSASMFSNIITTKGEPSKSATKYMHQLAAELITDTREETYQNAIMQRGIDLEPEARQLFEMITNHTVDQVGLCITDDGTASCSPDGLIGDHGGIEIKCPLPATHIDYLLKNKLPTTYYQQVHGSMYVTGREFWYFMSYCPGIKPLILKVVQDIDYLGKLNNELLTFNSKLSQIVEEIRV